MVTFNALIYRPQEIPKHEDLFMYLLKAIVFTVVNEEVYLVNAHDARSGF